MALLTEKGGGLGEKEQFEVPLVMRWCRVVSLLLLPEGGFNAAHSTLTVAGLCCFIAFRKTRSPRWSG
jgi:hypothetical protein